MTFFFLKWGYSWCDPKTTTTTTSGSDGIVQGTSAADIIGAGYVDADGDKIDGGDAKLASEVGDDDIIDSGAGNDVIYALKGNDEVFAGGGNDYVDGGVGNDEIHGDASLNTTTSAGGAREKFEWDKAVVGGKTVSDDTNIASGFTLDTGETNVTFSVIATNETPSTTFETETQKVHSITDDGKGVEDNSSMASSLNSADESATFQWSFDNPVEDVSFRINDIDYDSKVVVKAYDASGNLLSINVSYGNDIDGYNLDAASGKETLVSDGSGGSDTDPDHSALINIAGPVSYFTIEHTQYDHHDSEINVTDIYFTTTPAAAGSEEAGDDTLLGGEGDDTIYGEGENDSIEGGAGNDLIYGDSGTNGAAPTTSRESFEWDKAPDPNGPAPIDNNDPLSAFTQNTGNVDVTFSVAGSKESPSTSFATDQQKVHSITTDGPEADKYSSLESHLNSKDESATYKWEFSDAGATKTVENISFRINDLDEDSKVVITAFDEFGNKVAVNTSYGSNISGSDKDGVAGNETLVSKGGHYSDTSPESSVLVNIAGPVAYFTVTHTQVGYDTSEVNITDMYFDVTSGPTQIGDDGDDYIDGGEGDDTIYGEGGNDTIIGGLGNDSMMGGDDEDTFVGGNVGDFVDGGEGGVDNDTLDLRGLGPLDVVLDSDDPAAPTNNPENGTVTFFDGSGNPTGTMRFINIENVLTDPPPPPPALDGIVEGDDNANLIDINYTGDPEGDRIDNNDAILGNVGSNDDIVEAEGGNDTVYAGLGNDTIEGGLGDDVMYGETGDDVITDEGGSDFADGGEGDDVIDVSSPANLGAGTPDRGYPGLFTGDSDPFDDRDTVYGGDGNDNIKTGDDNDEIYGGAGNDTIDSGVDDDFVDGGDGDDYIIASEGSDLVYGGEGNDEIWGGAGPVLPDALNIRDDLGDLVTDNGKDTIYGGAGNDSIYGQDDDDEIYGGEGDDYLDGGIDNDLIRGGAGNDTILGGQGDDEIYGDEGDDYIEGGDGNDSIYGLEGDDEIYGGAGDDFILGSIGDDTIYAGEGNDNVEGAADADTIFLDEGDDFAKGGAGDDEIHGGTGNDTINGDAGNDTIYGDEGDDELYGDNGQDVFYGGEGADRMFGQDDEDTFVGATAGDYVDGGEGFQAGHIDYDVLDLSGLGPLKINYDPSNVENGTVDFLDGVGNVTGTMTFKNIEEVIPCFTPGTVIATPKGERLVEELRAGDRVITRDNGIQEIRWIGEKAISGQELASNDHLRPVLIQKGSLGYGLPERDMLVSPNHRVLVNNDKTALYFEEREVLVAAKHLTGLAGVDVVNAMRTTYIHFMFDRHEVVLSNGAWTESFQPGEQSLKGVGNAQRNEIYELFPELKSLEGQRDYHSARRTLKKHEARLLAK